MGIKYLEFDKNAIDKVDINCKICKIRVVSSVSDNIEISWNDTAMRKLEIVQDERVLHITDHASVGVYGTLALINLKKDNQILIKIPEAYSGIIIFQTKNEPIHLTDLNLSAAIGLSANTGEVLLENVKSSKIDIRGNNGKINCYSVSVTEAMSISSKSGHIQCYINGTEEEYSVFCKTNNRRQNCPEITGSGAKKLQIISETGSISLAFQNAVQMKKPTNRYNRRGSFSEW